MAILIPRLSRNWALLLRVLLFSSGVLSVALILKLSVPAVTEFAVSDVPLIWEFVASWLRPPYLYFVINCIILTIVASSILRSDSDETSVPPETAMPVTPVKVTGVIRTEHELPYGAKLMYPDEEKAVKVSDSDVFEEKAVKASDFDEFGHVGGMVSEMKTETTRTTTESVSVMEENTGSDEIVISKPPHKKDSMEFPPPTDKPLVSSRFGHRRVVKASSEGGKTLRVSKPKTQETLESTWKTITEGRSMPLTRHLKKSDTWDLNQITPPATTNNWSTMTKSETLDVQAGGDRGKCSSSEKLRKVPSPSQEELNRRVEAFINNFNEQMRLQRQESLNQYLELINRGYV